MKLPSPSTCTPEIGGNAEELWAEKAYPPPISFIFKTGNGKKERGVAREKAAVCAKNPLKNSEFCLFNRLVHKDNSLDYCASA